MTYCKWKPFPDRAQRSWLAEALETRRSTTADPREANRFPTGWEVNH